MRFIAICCTFQLPFFLCFILDQYSLQFVLNWHLFKQYDLLDITTLRYNFIAQLHFNKKYRSKSAKRMVFFGKMTPFITCAVFSFVRYIISWLTCHPEAAQFSTALLQYVSCINIYGAVSSCLSQERFTSHMTGVLFYLFLLNVCWLFTFTQQLLFVSFYGPSYGSARYLFMILSSIFSVNTLAT